MITAAQVQEIKDQSIVSEDIEDAGTQKVVTSDGSVFEIYSGLVDESGSEYILVDIELPEGVFACVDAGALVCAPLHSLRIYL